uniref:Uncharacterized protein n=1 Tax=Anopheles atroparvus TaxID=41427 RepID=A0A182JIW5_ANOAO
MLPFILVLLTLGSTLGAGVLEESSWRTVERDLAPDALLVRLDRLVNVCVANYEDLTTDLLLGIAIANAQLRSILKQPLREPQRQFVESLAKKCDFVESRIESTFNFPSGANAVDECLSELLVMESENEYNATGTSGNGKNQKRLTLSRECSAAMSLRKRSYGYHLTHKLLFYIVLARQRFANVDRSFVSAGQRKLCEQILREADLIAGFDFPDLFRDLFMEQVFLCAFSHHSELPEFTNPAWLAAIVGWQNGEGCFKYYADEGDGVVGPNALTTHCSTHMTGVGAALLGLFARLQLVQ